jgi:hypothetical protein
LLFFWNAPVLYFSAASIFYAIVFLGGAASDSEQRSGNVLAIVVSICCYRIMLFFTVPFFLSIAASLFCFLGFPLFYALAFGAIFSSSIFFLYLGVGLSHTILCFSLVSALPVPILCFLFASTNMFYLFLCCSLFAHSIRFGITHYFGTAL